MLPHHHARTNCHLIPRLPFSMMAVQAFRHLRCLIISPHNLGDDLVEALAGLEVILGYFFILDLYSFKWYFLKQCSFVKANIDWEIIEKFQRLRNLHIVTNAYSEPIPTPVRTVSRKKSKEMKTRESLDQTKTRKHFSPNEKQQTFWYFLLQLGWLQSLEGLAKGLFGTSFVWLMIHFG